VELQRQLRVVSQLGSAAYYRHPEAWTHALEGAAADVSSATDVPQATRLVAEGRAAARAGDRDRVRGIVLQLWSLMPHDARSRQLGHGSGLR
jgi:molecular chaperone DnaK